MNHLMIIRLFLITALFLPALSLADSPMVGEATVLGPFTGEGAHLHPDNISPHRIAYYGTDLGFTYQHGDQLHILFGDTMADSAGNPIEASTGRTFEDSYGTISLAEWSDPTAFSPRNIPLIKLGQNPGSTEMAAINPGHAMEGFKTPVGGFSNGTTEYGFFYSANIIEQWTRPTEDGVDIIWNASTWDPYRVILLRTHIRR